MKRVNDYAKGISCETIGQEKIIRFITRYISSVEKAEVRKQ